MSVQLASACILVVLAATPSCASDQGVRGSPCASGPGMVEQINRLDRSVRNEATDRPYIRGDDRAGNPIEIDAQ
jgi:hypothetical protein